jgi:hypothetical protein
MKIGLRIEGNAKETKFRGAARCVPGKIFAIKGIKK